MRAILLVGLLACLGCFPERGATAQQPAVEGPAAATALLLDAVAAMDRELPAVLDDPAALAATLADADAAFAWVRDNTVLTPYRGRLKGARGVLIDRSGNSLDRSLLLAALVAPSGEGIRLVRAALGAERSAEMLGEAEWRNPPLPPDPDPGALGDLEGLMAGMVPPERIACLRQQMERRGDSAFDRVEQLSLALAQAAALLAKGRADMRAAAERSRQESAAADHWWLQVQIDGAWTDLDPTLPEPGQTRSAVFDPVDPAALPADAEQRVEVAVVVEALAESGHRVLRTALEGEFPTSELLGQQISLRFEGMSGPDRTAVVALGRDPDQLHHVLAAQRAWVPVLDIGQVSYRDQYFDSEGGLFDAAAHSLETLLATAVRRGVERGAGAATTLLEQLGTGAEDRTGTGEGVRYRLSGVWLRIAVLIPGEAPRREWRALYDEFDRPAGVSPASPPEMSPAGSGEPLRRAIALATDIRLLVAPARTTGAWYARQVARQLGAAGPALRVLSGEAHAGEGAAGETSAPEAALVAASDALNRANLDLLAVDLQRRDLNFAAESLYQDRPFLLLALRGSRLARDGAFGFGMSQIHMLDILENRQGVRLALAGDPFEARLAQGIADTVAEAMAVPEDLGAANAALFHSADLRAGRTWSRIDAGGVPEGASGAALAHLDRDLSRGFAVVAPAGMPDRPLAWWRIDPATGETLGIVE